MFLSEYVTIMIILYLSAIVIIPPLIDKINKIFNVANIFMINIPYILILLFVSSVFISIYFYSNYKYKITKGEK